jgi:hypothetical protein
MILKKDRQIGRMFASDHDEIVIVLELIPKSGSAVMLFVDTEKVYGGIDEFDWPVVVPYANAWKKGDTEKKMRRAIKGAFSPTLERDLKLYATNQLFV